MSKIMTNQERLYYMKECINEIAYIRDLLDNRQTGLIGMAFLVIKMALNDYFELRDKINIKIVGD